MFLFCVTNTVRLAGALLAALALIMPTAASADDIDEIAAIVSGGRYMESSTCTQGQSPATDRCCQTVKATDPLLKTTLKPYASFRRPVGGHQGLQDCRYANNGLETRVIMLNPTRARVAEWTISACEKASAKSTRDCAKWVWDKILDNSGSQFAVAGAVVEKNGSNCRPKDPQPKIVGYIFRDGVTVRLANADAVCSADAALLSQEPSPFFEDPSYDRRQAGPAGSPC